jgi:hypothetical protein
MYMYVSPTITITITVIVAIDIQPPGMPSLVYLGVLRAIVHNMLAEVTHRVVYTHTCMHI